MIVAYPDAELVMMGIHAPLGNVVTWIPPDPPNDLVVVQRIGGSPDGEDLTDYALMRVLYFGDTRNAAWSLAAQGESLVLSHRGRTVKATGHPADGILVDFATIEVGGALDPDLDPDERRVTKNYTIGLRRQAQPPGV